MIRRAPRETDLHIAVADYFAAVLIPPTLAFHVPNGGYRLKTEAAILQRMGVKAGMPDWCILYESRAHFLELKTATGKLNAAQREILDRLTACGCPWCIARSIDGVRAALLAWRIPTREYDPNGDARASYEVAIAALRERHLAELGEQKDD